MLRRLGIGLVKGLVIGLGVGAGLHFGLHWAVTPGLLGFLVAMGTGSTAGVLAGNPPWRQDGWVESVLKSAVGMGLAALVLGVARHYANRPFPLGLPHVPAGTPWTELPILFAPLVGALFGAMVELDNTERPNDAREAT